MAGKTAILSVRVISDTKQAQRGAAETATAFEKFEKRLDKATIAAGGTALGLLKLGKDAYKAAADLQQSGGGIESVFKDHAKTITDFAKTSWETVGLSENKMNESATLLGAQLKNLGTPMEDVAGTTIDLTKKASDLAATFGGPTSDAVAALSSLLKGERNPIERYGVTITEAMVKAKALSMGLAEVTQDADKVQAASQRAEVAQRKYNEAVSKYGKDSTQALTASSSMIQANSALEKAMEGNTAELDMQAKAQATLALLYEQTADSTGQWTAELDTASGAAAANAARWETVQAQLGTKLLPLMTAVSTALIDLAGWVAENSDLVLTLATVVGGAAAAVIGLNGAIKTARVVSTVFTGITTAGTATVGMIGRFVGGMRSAAVAQSTFSGAAGTLGGKVTQLVTAMGKGALAAGRWAVQTTVLTAKLVAQKVAQLAIAVASRTAAIAQGVWNAVMNANPVMLIITLIVAAIVLLVMNWEKVQQVAIAVWDAISAAAAWFYDKVLTPIGQFITGKLAAGWAALKLAAIATWIGIRTAGETVWNGLKSIGSWISSNLLGAWNRLKSTGVNALDAIIAPVRNLIGWLQDAWGWVSKVFDGAGKIAGRLFKFSDASDPTARSAAPGSPVTAAFGPARVLFPYQSDPTPTARGGDTYNFNFPNYHGDRNELIEWIRTALAKSRQNHEGIIYA